MFVMTRAPSYFKGKLSELPLFVLVLGAVSSCDNIFVITRAQSYFKGKLSQPPFLFLSLVQWAAVITCLSVTRAPSYFKGNSHNYLFLFLSLVQWAAVITCVSVTRAPPYFKGKLSQLPLFVVVLGTVSSHDNMLVSDQSTNHILKGNSHNYLFLFLSLVQWAAVITCLSVTIAPSYFKGKLSQLPLFVLVLGAVSSCDNMLVSDQSTII